MDSIATCAFGINPKSFETSEATIFEKTAAREDAKIIFFVVDVVFSSKNFNWYLKNEEFFLDNSTYNCITMRLLWLSFVFLVLSFIIL